MDTTAPAFDLNATLVSFTGALDDFMYTWILVFLLVAVGIYFTIRTGFVHESDREKARRR